MTDDPTPPDPQPGQPPAPDGSPRWPILRCIAPLGLFLVLGSLEPAEVQGDQVSRYVGLYALKIFLSVAAAVWAWPLLRRFQWRPCGWSLAVGLVGGGVWIALAQIDLTPLFDATGLTGILGSAQRVGLNPWQAFPGRPGAVTEFLLLRFTGLVLVVPLIEELFLRGFLVRYFQSPDWQQVPVGKADRIAVLVVSAYAMATHPAELVAALVWFLLVTWWAARTRCLGDCVVAHAVTNLVLGIYILAASDWRLW